MLDVGVEFARYRTGMSGALPATVISPSSVSVKLEEAVAWREGAEKLCILPPPRTQN
jgi:hypothetical protein